MEELKQSPFNQDEDFFKSTGMTETGKLMKAIPVAEKTVKKVFKDGKKLPKGFPKFKKEVEDAFKLLDSIIKDLVAKKKPEQIASLMEHYGKFKNEFSWRVNDAIHYPDMDGDLKESSESDKTRIKI